MKKMYALTLFIGLGLTFASQAKLPDLSPEAKEAAELAKAKAAHGDKKAAFALCQAQNKVAKGYAVKDKVVATPDCADPGEFKAPVAAAPSAAPAPATTASVAPAKPAETPKK
jgi:hypothetical protein